MALKFLNGFSSINETLKFTVAMKNGTVNRAWQEVMP